MLYEVITLGEVPLLQQQGPVVAARRFHRYAKTGGTATDDDQVPERFVFKLLQ